MNMNKISSVQSKTDIEIVYLFTFREGFLVCPINIFMMLDLRYILYIKIWATWWPTWWLATLDKGFDPKESSVGDFSFAQDPEGGMRSLRRFSVAHFL